TILFFILFLLWTVFSGKFDPFHLSLGVISSIIVSLFAGPLIPELRGKGLLRSWGRFLSYLPWLLWQIWLANLHMLRLSFSPRVLDLIEPEIITFNPGLKKDLSKLTLANSITLTPGTITISIGTYGTFRVHRIDKASAEGITSGTMIEKVKKAFGES
ncbi:MAG: Na+/H+ antiporter subunit E, partial [Desulfatiglandales bacterium]